MGKVKRVEWDEEKERKYIDIILKWEGEEI